MTHFIETDSLIMEIPFNGILLNKLNEINYNFNKNKYIIYDKIQSMLNEDELLQLKESDLEDLLGKPKYDIAFNLLIFPKKLPNGKDITINVDITFENIKVNIN